MSLSVTTAQDYASLLARATGLEVLVTRGRRARRRHARDRLGRRRAAARRGRDRRRELPHHRLRDARVRRRRLLGVHVLLPEDELDDAVSDNALFIGAHPARVPDLRARVRAHRRALAAGADRAPADGRQQHRQGRLLVEVPTEGNDEFAALGKEFNSMARQLETRLEELQLERARLQETVRRVGESLGKGLDRDALLGIVVQTAVDGVGAECGRVVMRSGANGTLAEAARAGNVSSYIAAVSAAEAAAMEAGEAAETQLSGANALARPLAAPEPEDGVLGVISIARPGRPFSQRQRELFEYLTNQAAISIENVDLHEQVQRQAVTDELTGPVQPPPLPGGHHGRGRAHAALRPGARPDHARHRRLQARQRHLRAPPGRRGAQGGRARAARVLARDRRAGALRRRGDGGRAAADRARGRVRVRRARAPADRERSRSRCSTATARCA